MTLNQLRYFHTIAETGSMGQAAKKLYLSQPSLSVSINRLEEEFGVTLFDHVGHHLRLTPDGEIFLRYADKILRDVEVAEGRMKLLSENHRHILRLGCIEPAFNKYVPYVMRQFLNIPENADTQFELFTDTTDNLVQRMKDGELDLLISATSESEDVIQTPLFTMPLALLSPKDTRELPGSKAALKNRIPLSWSRIASLPLIGYTPGSSMDYLLSRVAADEQVNFHYVYLAPNEEAIAALVYHGFGYGIVPVTDTLSSSTELSLTPLSGNHYQTIYLTRLKDRQYRGASLRFIAFMEQMNS